MSIPLLNGLAHQSVDHVMEDLLVRFVVNCPDEDLSSIERVFFQVEEAQWFYTDFVRLLDPKLPPMKMKQFAGKMLEKAPLIWKWGDPGDALARFGHYKSTIPVRGVACFNPDFSKVLLVKGTDSNSWSFPRGKISKGESDIECAVREAEEEIGFNARQHINENDVMERTIRGKNYKIYLARNVPETFNFAPKARNEISQIQWFDVKSLVKKVKQSPNQFFIVETMMKPLQKWINQQKGVVAEEELMYRAEMALKELLGLTKPLEKTDDAGRELLNILQGPQTGHAQTQPQPHPGQPGPPPMIQIPHYVYQPVQQFLPGPMPFPPMPMQFAPPQQPPNPQSLQKPTMKPESKELLSILNSSGTPKRSRDATPTAGRDANRSKADELLSLFKKPSKNPVETSPAPSVASVPSVGATGSAGGSVAASGSVAPQPSTQPRDGPAGDLLSILHRKGQSPAPFEPSNELEGSMRGSQPGPKKVTVLKRSENKNANDLLSLLKPKKEDEQSGGEAQAKEIQAKEAQPREAQPREAQPKESPSQELLGMLRGKPDTPAQGEAAQPQAQSHPVQAQSQSHPVQSQSQFASSHQSPTQPAQPAQPAPQTSNPLLDMLHNPREQKSASNELLGMLHKSQSGTPASGSPAPSKNPASQDLLNLLKPKEKPEPAPQPQETPEFEDFEDFEDFGDLDHQFSRTFHNFDIESDEEDVDHLLENNKPIDFFKQQASPDKIQIAKPGSLASPQPHYQPQFPQQVYEPQQGTPQAAGQSLLALLNGGKQQQNPNAEFFNNLLNKGI
ncbi:m7GpppN-mRNA hydrolase [Diutina catenulata]